VSENGGCNYGNLHGEDAVKPMDYDGFGSCFSDFSDIFW
jgi:hypothetical protein